MAITDAVGMVEQVATIIAILVGGFWTYFHFIKGRIYRPRLIAKIDGSIKIENDQIYLLVTSTISNVGKSVVELKSEGTAIRVHGHERIFQPEGIQAVDWDRLGTYPVFEKHGWLEGEETIEEERLFLLPASEFRAFRLELRVISNQIAWTHGRIITVFPKEEAQNA